jgi:hypothetical protein
MTHFFRLDIVYHVSLPRKFCHLTRELMLKNNKKTAFQQLGKIDVNLHTVEIHIDEQT